MGSFIAEITEIESVQSLHRVELLCKENILSMISLELPQNIKIGSQVQLYVKSTNIVIARHPENGLSIANQLISTVSSIQYGTILTMVKLDFNGITLEAMLTTKQAKKLNLQEKESVYALINESDLSLSLLER